MADDIQTRIARLLDRLERPDISDFEIKQIERKLEILRSLEQQE